MKHSYWFVLGVVGAAASQSAACSSRFRSCSETRTCTPLPKSDAGEAGENSDEEGKGNASQGGSPGSKAGAAGDAGETGEAGVVEGGGPAGSGGVLGGSGGAPAGGGGMVVAGAGGQTLPVGCVNDSDCSDHLACNGVETCLLGVCKPGNSPCANPEPAHCDAVCSELNGAASCSVRGHDVDKDGHFTTACVASPGDDCDDAAATVYAGAPELCDGLDNNCNKKIDLSDGLTAGGTTVAIGPSGVARSSPSIAWAPDKSVYGIAYRDMTTSNASDLYFEEIEQSGAISVSPKPFNDTATKTKPGTNGGFAFTWGGDSFGVAWNGSDGGYFRTIGSDDSVSVGVVQMKQGTFDYFRGEPALARDPGGGNWAALFRNESTASDTPNSAAGFVISATGAVNRHELDYNYPQAFSIAASGGNFAIAFDRAQSTNGVELWSSTLTSPKPLSLVVGSSIVIGAGSNGLGVASASTSAAPQFYALAANGSVQCGPVPFADKSFVPSAIAPTANGYLVASSGVLRVQEIFGDCSPGALFTVDPGQAGDVKIAAGSTTYGIVWQDFTGGSPGIPKRRLFGKKYCN